MSIHHGNQGRLRGADRRRDIARGRRLAPELMALEDRQLLSQLIHVTSAADSGPGTLRAAVAKADAATRPVTIDFQLPADSTITLTSGQLELSNAAEPVAIDGPGAGLLTVSGGANSGIFQVNPGVTASISGMTVTDGYDTGKIVTGSDVNNQGTLSLTGVTLTQGNTKRIYTSLNNSGSVTLQGCTVTDILVDEFGALVNAGSSASMSVIDCLVTGNEGIQASAIDDRGGALTITGSTFTNNDGESTPVNAYSGSSVRVSDCTVSGNIGFINDSAASTTITDSTFTGNFFNPLAFGGGGDVTLVDCTISGNQGPLGGGVDNLNGPLTMIGCTISDNVSFNNDLGAGGVFIYSYNSVTTITDCVITGNTGPNGGMYINSDATLNNCTISGNSAIGSDPQRPKLTTGKGGGISTVSYLPTDVLTLNACTITGNSANLDGGGLYASAGYYGTPSHITLNDTIIAGNTTHAGPSDVAGVGAPDLTGKYNLIGTGGSGGLSPSDNLLNVANPGLTPLGDYGGPTETVALQPNSPALHAGAFLPGITTDQRGFPLDNSSFTNPDIGAFQSRPGPLVVDTAIDGIGSALGQLSLRQAVNLANVLNGGDAITFDKAAFAGKQTITLDDGPLELSNTTGPVSIAGTTAARLTISGGGASRVFQVAPGANVTLSNLTIAGGVASGNGGGVLNAGTLTLANVVVAGDTASVGGGGVYNSGSLFASNVTISGDQAANGGGIDNTGSAVILGSSIDGNSATSDGGGIDNAGFLSLGDSDLSANSATLDGGGLFDIGTATLFFCTVDSNAAASGGGIFVDPSTTPAVLVSTTLAKNKGGNIVGAVIRL